MAKPAYPMTPGIRLLREKQIDFVPHLYPFEEHGGTQHAAEMLQLPEHTVIKTLIMETDTHAALIVLMHGDRAVSTRQLARALGARHVQPCGTDMAQKLTGYLVGGISPFGTRSPLPVCVESTIFSLDRIAINGGKRGFLIEINPAALRTAFAELREVNVAVATSE